LSIGLPQAFRRPTSLSASSRLLISLVAASSSPVIAVAAETMRGPIIPPVSTSSADANGSGEKIDGSNVVVTP
jgi:hypothetical protein